MQTGKWIVFLLTMALGQSAAAQTHPPRAGQTFPTKPIRLVVPFTAASQTDMLARMIGPKMAENWGQQVIVDNRPGAGGSVAGNIIATSSPDGYNLLLSSSAFASSAALGLKLPYDPLKDFAGVTQVATTANIWVVAPSLGVKSAKELIALARQKPGQINYASAGVGSGTHYIGELFKLSANIDVVHVPYKGTPEALTDVMAGRVQYYIAPIMAALPLIRSGRVVPLAITNAQRAPLLPDVPTLAEAAIPGFHYDGWFGLWVHAKTPRKLIDTLSGEVARILALPDVKERIVSQGAVPKSSTPEALNRLVRAEVETRSKVFKVSGARGQ